MGKEHLRQIMCEGWSLSWENREKAEVEEERKELLRC
jgi:hypothetical protein